MSRAARKSSQRLAAPLSAQDAAVYATQVVPRYNALFGRLIVSEIPAGERLQVLDVGCGTGYPALEILERLGEGGRVIAIDPDPALIDVARRRALDDSGRRIFFKGGSAESLRFGDEVFDVVVGNLILGAVSQPEAALAEMRRVLAPGGRLVLTQALDGTFEEIFDMFREVALKRDDGALTKRLERIGKRYPSAATFEAVLRGAGFEEVSVRVEEFQLPFARAAEIFTDAAVRFVALPEWRWIAGFGEGSDSILGEVQRSLDTYFGGGPLTLRVVGGAAVARA